MIMDTMFVMVQTKTLIFLGGYPVTTHFCAQASMVLTTVGVWYPLYVTILTMKQ